MNFNQTLINIGQKPVSNIDTDDNTKYVGTCLSLLTKEENTKKIKELFTDKHIFDIATIAKIINTSIDSAESINQDDYIVSKGEYFNKLVKVHDDGVYNSIERMMEPFARKLNKRIGFFIVGSPGNLSIWIGYRPENSEKSRWILIYLHKDSTKFFELTSEDFKDYLKQLDDPIVCPIFRKDIEDLNIFDDALTLYKEMKKWTKKCHKGTLNSHQIAKNYGYGGSVNNLKPYEFVESICASKKNTFRFGSKSSVFDALVCLLPDIKKEGLVYTPDNGVNWQWKHTDEDKIKEWGLILAIKHDDKLMAIMNPMLKK